MADDILQAKAEVSEVHTGIRDRDRSALADGLSRALAETYILYVKTQGFHWNVVGPLFYGLHKMTEEQYEDLAEAVDHLAERIRAIGYPAPASFKQFVELSSIGEVTEVPTAEDAIMMLIDDHEKVARTFRDSTKIADELDDLVTADLLTQRLFFHENAAWMLRSMVAK
ncbi:MAG TPA: Dps family protein [Sphingomonadales bacterium]|mgnify:CR=1 FL=1